MNKLTEQQEVKARMTKMAWEELYSDKSGVEFAVRFDANKDCSSTGEPGRIEFESITTVWFPLSKIDWLIDCLQKIKAEQQSNNN